MQGAVHERLQQEGHEMAELPGADIGYTAAGDLLDRLGEAWQTHDGDLLVALLTDDAEYHVSPFQPPLVGHNAARAHLLEAAEAQDQVEVTFERHWASGSTVLAAWHMSYVGRSDRLRVRVAGFVTLEMRADRCSRLRLWTERRPEADGAG